jgi:hypothetical protein
MSKPPLCSLQIFLYAIELDDCIALRDVHIYSDNPPGNPRPRGCTDVGGLTARRPVRLLGRREGETLINLSCHPGG